MVINIIQPLAGGTPVPTQRVLGQRALGLWLVVVAVFIALMVVVGGATRLTESGLSIVDWKPFTGMVPPLSDADWLKEFAAYKLSPQYLKVNQGMSLAAFKSIFWWEWGHRELGRALLLVFVLPLSLFINRARTAIQPWLPRLALIFAIGCLQPLIGWLMVKSGLKSDPHVSHYRLTLHLLTAMWLFAATVWTAFDILAPRSGPLKRANLMLLGLLGFQILLGGFVAGLRAGFAFNTWPLMGDRFAPEGMWSMLPGWQNLLSNPITVQFMHRCVAYTVFGYGLLVALRAINQPDSRMKRYGALLATALLAQVVLGIATVVSGVPVWLGTAHQAGAVVVLASVLTILHYDRMHISVLKVTT